jgi:hypothetical protein
MSVRRQKRAGRGNFSLRALLPFLFAAHNVRGRCGKKPVKPFFSENLDKCKKLDLSLPGF